MKTYTLTLPLQALEVIRQGLGKLPMEVAFDVFVAIQQQKEAQDKPPEAPQSHADKEF